MGKFKFEPMTPPFQLRRSLIGIEIKVKDWFNSVGAILLFANVLALGEEADFEALSCLPPQNLIRSTNLHLTTEPPIFCRCCYKLAFCLPCSLSANTYVFLPF